MQPRTDVTISVASLASPTRGLAAWGIALRSGIHSRQFGGYTQPEAKVTTNAASVYAVLQAINLLRVPCVITLRSESLYVQQSGKRLERWERSGWMKTDEEGFPRPVANDDLWRQVLDAIRGGGHVMHEWTPVGRHRVQEVRREGEMIHTRPVGDPVPRDAGDVLACQKAEAAMTRAKERHQAFAEELSPASPPWFPAGRARSPG